MGVINSFAKAVVVAVTAVAFDRFASADGCMDGCDGGPGDRPGAGSPFVAWPPNAFTTTHVVNTASNSKLRFMSGIFRVICYTNLHHLFDLSIVDCGCRLLL